jgi:translation initiation factor IF-3
VHSTAGTIRDSGGAGIAAEKRNRVNGEIRAERLLLIGEDGSQLGIVSMDEALAEGEQRGFDVVEMSPNADPPVCRLMDYGKFQFQQSKKKQAARRKQQQTQIKEVKFRPGTDDGDYQIKLRNLRRFLDHGHKIKVTLWFRGREMAHQDLGQKLLRRIEGDLAEEAKVEQFPRLEGRRLAMVMTPRKPPAARQSRKLPAAVEKEPPVASTAPPPPPAVGSDEAVRDEAAAAG